MRNILALICFSSFFSAIAHAQQDTVFFDANWKELPNKKNAAFFRSWPKEENGKYNLIDYYISGKVQMTGYYKSANIIRLTDFDERPQYKDGRFEYFRSDGSRIDIREFSDGKRNGQFISYDSTGKVILEGGYKDDHLNGLWKSYYNEGNLWVERSYTDDSLDGILKSYYKNGKLKRDATYSNGKLIKGLMYDQNGKPIPYTEYMIMPDAPYNVSEYLGKTVKYPRTARYYEIEGKVAIQFTVDEKGNIVEPKIVKSAHPILDNEALRVIRKMPKWKPGIVDDIPMNTYYTLPVTFRLED